MEPKRNVSRKLTAERARQLRVDYANGATIQELERRYDVSNSTVWNVVNYETWVSAGPPRSWLDTRRKPRSEGSGPGF